MSEEIPQIFLMLDTVYVILERDEDDDVFTPRIAYRTEGAAQAEADALTKEYGECDDECDTRFEVFQVGVVDR